MSKATITIEGYLSRDPELKTTRNGKSYLQLSIPHTPRKQENGQWVDAGDTTWFQATAWDADAEYLSSRLVKGTPVMLTGSPEVNVYQTRDGAHAANIVLKFPTIAIIQKAPKGYQGGGGQAEEPWGAPAQDSWAQPSASFNDETPF